MDRAHWAELEERLGASVDLDRSGRDALRILDTCHDPPLCEYLRAFIERNTQGVAACRAARKRWVRLLATKPSGLIGPIHQRLGDTAICIGHNALALPDYLRAAEAFAAAGDFDHELDVLTLVVGLQLQGPHPSQASVTLQRAVGAAASIRDPTRQRQSQQRLQLLWHRFEERIAERPKREAASRYRLQRFDSENGLSSAKSRGCLVFGDRVWVITGAGLEGYDGVRWTDFAGQSSIDSGGPINGAFVGSPDSIWLATERATYRCAGESCQRLDVESGLPQARMGGLYEDRQGGVWLYGPSGLARYHGGLVTAYPAPTKVDLRAALEAGPGHARASLLEDRAGRIWFLSASGLFRLEGDTFRNVGRELDGAGLPEQMVLGPDGLPWFATGRGICRWREVGCAWLGTAQGLLSDEVAAIIADAEPSLWVVTALGLNRLSGDEVVLSERFPWFVGKPISSGCGSTAPGELWCAMDGGLVHYATQGANAGFERFPLEERSRSTAQGTVLNGFCVDIRSGVPPGVWVTTKSKGVVRVGAPRWEIYDARNATGEDNVRAVRQDASGALWLGTPSQGATRIEPGGAGITTYRPVDGLCGVGNGGVSAIEVGPGGKVWLAGQNGISVAFDNALTYFGPGHGLWPSNVLDLAVNPAGEVWAATALGVVKLDEGRGQAFLGPPGYEAEAAYVVLVDSAGALWAGGAGLTRFRDGEAARVDSQQGLFGDRITALYEEQPDVLWVGTNQGAGRCDVSAWPRHRCRMIDTTHGLRSNEVTAFAQDGLGRVAIGTTAGLCLTDSQEAGASVRCIGEAEGLPSSVITDLALDATGHLLIATEAGVARERAEPVLPPETFLIGPDGYVVAQSTLHGAGTLELYAPAHSGGRKVRLAGRSFVYPKEPIPPELVLAEPGHVFTALAIDPNQATPPETLLYSFQLDDLAWTPYAASAQLTLPRLANGPHTLRARAKNAGLAVDPTPAERAFVLAIPMPWYAQVGYGLLSSCGVLLLGVWQRRRIHQGALRLRHWRYRPIPAELFVQQGPVTSPQKLIGWQALRAELHAKAARVSDQNKSVVVWG
jgi:ligand-binding sensor domain-containing protein